MWGQPVAGGERMQEGGGRYMRVRRKRKVVIAVTVVVREYLRVLRWGIVGCLVVWFDGVGGVWRYDATKLFKALWEMEWEVKRRVTPL